MGETSLKEKTAKGLLWGSIGNGSQQLLNLLFGIVLARLLSPSDYGMVGMLTIFSAIVGTLQDSGFTVALANKKDVGHKDYNAVFWFSLLMGIGLYTLLFFSSPLIAKFYHRPELTSLARFVFLGSLISSASTAHNAYLFKNLMVRQRTMAAVPALIVSGTVGVIMAMNGMSYWGIATQSLVFIAIVNGSFWYFSPWRPTFQFDFRPLREMFGFSSKMLVTNTFLQFNNNIVSAVLGRFFSIKDVGFFTQSNKWNTMGYSFITGTVNSVAQPVLSTVSDDPERACRTFRKMLRFTAFMSFPAMFGIALIAPELIVITITEKWAACIVILQLLCVWGAVMPITTLYSNLIISKRKSSVYMWNTIVLAIIQLGLMVVLHRFGLYCIVMTTIGTNIMWFFVWHYFVNREIGIKLSMAFKDILPFAAIAAFTMVATYFITSPIHNIYIRFGMKIIVAAAIYFIILRICGAKILNESVSFLLSYIKKGKK